MKCKYCKYCKEEGCPFRCYTEEGECSYEELSVNNFDWQSFRNQAAKDILCYGLPTLEIIDGDFQQSIKNAISNSIDVANELVKQLKENERMS
jgi:hypothetical protein